MDQFVGSCSCFFNAVFYLDMHSISLTKTQSIRQIATQLSNQKCLFNFNWKFLLDSPTGPMNSPPSVCQLQKFSYFPSLVFSVFLQQVSLFQMLKSDEARFLKKKSGFPEILENRSKNLLFQIFLKILSLVFFS